MTLERAYEAYQKEDFDGAEALLDPLLRQGTHQGAVLHLSALTALKRGETYAALQRINVALLDPTHAHEMQNTRGLILRARGTDIEAAEAFRQALVLKPDYLKARENLASILIATGDPVAAQPELRNIIQHGDPSGKYTLALARVLTELNQDTEALALLQSADIHKYQRGLECARVYLETNKSEAALSYLSQAYSDPKYAADALRLSLQIFAMSGTWESLGPALIAEITGLHPDVDAVWATSINIAYRMNEKVLAKTLFAQSPKGPASLSARAEQMTLQSDFISAENLAVSALKIIPGFKPALSQYSLSSLGKGEHAQSQQIADLHPPEDKYSEGRNYSQSAR